MRFTITGTVVLLLLMNLSLVTTQEFDTVPGCIPSGTTIVFTKTLNCPCYLGYSLFSPIDTATTTDFLLLRTSEYKSWQRNNFTSSPSVIPQHSTLNASTTTSLFRTPSETGRGSYTFIIRTHTQNPDCSLRLLHLFLPIPLCADQRGNKIVGGVPATSLTRHMAILESPTGYCSGTLLSDRHILTAAHCEIQSGIARIGTPTGPVYAIQSFQKHPLYKPSNTLPRFDIGVITLQQGVNSTHGTGLRFAKEGRLGDDVVVTGFGQTHERVPGTAFRELRAVTVERMQVSRCRQRFSKHGYPEIGNELDEGMVCLGGGCGDSCYGDSGGGALISENGSFVVVAIVSAGIGCGRSGLPGVYTDVRKFSGWVEDVVGVGGVAIGDGNKVVGAGDERGEVVWIGVGVVVGLVGVVVGVAGVNWGIGKIGMGKIAGDGEESVSRRWFWWSGDTGR